MITLLEIDSLKVTSGVTNGSSLTANLWFWIALAELIIIIFLLIPRKKSASKAAKNKKDIDFGNIINSAFNSKSLYDKLKIRCHPDRFSGDPEKEKIANELFEEISKHKTDLKKLQMLAQEAKEKLNITI